MPLAHFYLICTIICTLRHVEKDLHATKHSWNLLGMINYMFWNTQKTCLKNLQILKHVHKGLHINFKYPCNMLGHLDVLKHAINMLRTYMSHMSRRTYMFWNKLKTCQQGVICFHFWNILRRNWCSETCQKHVGKDLNVLKHVEKGLHVSKQVWNIMETG